MSKLAIRFHQLCVVFFALNNQPISHSSLLLSLIRRNGLEPLGQPIERLSPELLVPRCRTSRPSPRMPFNDKVYKLCVGGSSGQ